MKNYPHRWRIAVISCIMNLLLGVNYAWSILSGPLAQRLNEVNGFVGTAALTASSLAIVFSITNAILPVPMIVAGAVNDKYGPKAIVFVGGFLYGLGIILTGVVNSVGATIVTYSLMAGVGNGLVYACTVNNTVKFFPDRKGLIGGLTTASYGIGSIIYAPITRLLIARFGVGVTTKFFGIVIMVFICIGAFFLAKVPVQKQDGQAAKVPAARDCTWKDMLKKPIFYVLLLLLACGSSQGMMIISQASSIATEMVGTGVAVATLMVSLVAALNTSGRLICGYASDKIGRINVIAIAVVISLVGTVLLYLSAGGSVLCFALGACMEGLCFGCFMGVYPGLTADHFGTRNNTLNYGIMFIGNSIGAVVGPNIISAMYAGSGTYRPAFLLAGLLSIIGLLLVLICRRMASSEAV